ncbi:MAG: hypothetical protein J0M03_00035 [Acidobacteria bacterium]|nr:hypothetical protein [Acidobacteriota bacterium]
MSVLKPWADGAFDLIVHAELHLLGNNDFDRRIAIISFDNAIEVTITTYLELNPIQRQGKTYPRANVEIWQKNYHSKLDFFFAEITNRGLTVSFEKSEVVWYHDVRNGQYHGGGPTIPQRRELTEIRKVALDIFSILFDVSDVENLLKSRIADLTNSNLPKRDKNFDKLIDAKYGIVNIAGMTYYTSELLYNADPIAYSNLAKEIQEELKNKNSTGGTV